MKKVLLLIAVAVGTAFAASAQINKGSSYLGASINYGSLKGKSDLTSVNFESTSFGVSPSIAFAYKENYVWGLSLNYSYSKEVGSATKQNTYGVAAFLRQYKQLGKGVYLFIHEQLAGNYFTAKNIYGVTADYKGWGIGAGVSPGIAYDLSKRFQLELMMSNVAYANYNHSSVEQLSGVGTIKNSSNTVNVGSTLGVGNLGSFAIGGRYVFGR